MGYSKAWRRTNNLRNHAFYDLLVPTLGPRIIPALLERLRKASKSGDTVLEEDIVDGIVALESDEILTAVVKLLDDDSLQVRRAAARILARRPTPEALDSLWRLHCACYRDPVRFQRWEGEHYGFSYEDTFEALRACVALRPEWLEGTITNASAESDPVQDLAYLVARVQEPRLWERVKSQLLAKVPADKERSIARNVEVYRDVAKMSWLLERVPERTDLKGAAALRAIVRLAPERALDALERLPEEDLYFTRNWHVGELLIRIPEATRAHLLNWLKRHHSPWHLALVFQNNENRIDAAILDVLLDALAVLLEREKENAEESRDASLHRELNFLNRLAEPSLLDRLRLRRESRLEQLLTAWLVSKGPQEGGWRESDKHDAFDLLAKIGGPGLTTVLNYWLQGEWYARTHAMKLAARRPDETTIRLLVESSARSGDSARDAVERGHAAAALAGCRCWNEVVRYVLRSGAQTHTRVTDFRHEVERLDDSSVEPALLAFDEDPTNPGAVLALGFANRDEILPTLRSALATVGPDTNAALIISTVISWMGDSSEEVVRSLQRVFDARVHSRAALVALLTNGSETAKEVLWQRLRSEYHASIALALLGDAGYRERTIPLVQQRLRNADPYTSLELLDEMVEDPMFSEALDSILADDRLRDSVRSMAFDEEGSFRLGQGRASALRALARFDPQAAFVATKAALRSRLDSARERYPYLLVEIDSGRAVRDLLEHSKAETSTSVLWATSRAFAELDVKETLLEYLNSSVPIERETALRLAARLEPAEWLLSSVTARLDDDNVEVASAALSALKHLDDSVIAARLVQAIKGEADPTHRWALLDALLSVVDPGDIGRPMPNWATKLWAQLPLAMNRWLSDKLRERRKTVHREAKKVRR